MTPRGKAPRGATGIMDRARAALLGVAVGDALGATTEFMTPAEIRDRYGVLREIVGGGWLKLAPGQVTDDTEMTLCVARGIVRSGRWALGPIADRFAHWLSGEPADVGATCRRGIEEYMEKGRLEAPPDDVTENAVPIANLGRRHEFGRGPQRVSHGNAQQSRPRTVHDPRYAPGGFPSGAAQ